ncbi:hypothetical protein QFC21_001594 [Naganishia friedmannii]|uniref:Uncharacterized protein n=1 Tax=Naganishia friedmannii TaxID=89922 RepID=A0ACC2W1Q1_9TREE|nr:hypothetical protein QFC21_001594 [Naganishia friedmannii]
MKKTEKDRNAKKRRHEAAREYETPDDEDQSPTAAIREWRDDNRIVATISRLDLQRLSSGEPVTDAFVDFAMRHALHIESVADGASTPSKRADIWDWRAAHDCQEWTSDVDLFIARLLVIPMENNKAPHRHMAVIVNPGMLLARLSSGKTDFGPFAKQPDGDAPGQFDRGNPGQGGSDGTEAVDDHRIGAVMSFWRGCPGRATLTAACSTDTKQRNPVVRNDPIDLTEDDIQEALAPSGWHIEEEDDSGSELGDDDDADDDDASIVAPLEEELEQEASTEYAQGAPLAANRQSLTSNMNNDGSTFSQHASTAANRQVDGGMTVALRQHQVLSPPLL